MIIKTVKNIIFNILNLFKTCPLCDTPLGNKEVIKKFLFCKNCIDEIEDLRLKDEHSTKISFSVKKRKYDVYSLFEYDGKARNALLKYKMEGNIRYAQFYVPYVANWLKSMCLEKKNTLIIPLPSSKKGYKDRGFDQCIEILKLVDMPYSDLISINKKVKIQQKKLNAEERKTISFNKFILSNNITSVINQNDIKNIVLFDDVYTTGSSMKACITLIQEKLSDTSINILGLTLYRDSFFPV